MARLLRRHATAYDRFRTLPVTTLISSVRITRDRGIDGRLGVICRHFGYGALRAAAPCTLGNQYLLHCGARLVVNAPPQDRMRIVVVFSAFKRAMSRIEAVIEEEEQCVRFDLHPHGQGHHLRLLMRLVFLLFAANMHLPSRFQQSPPCLLILVLCANNNTFFFFDKKLSHSSAYDHTREIVR